MKEVSEEGAIPVSSWLRLRASVVHLYTASGAVLALLILVAAYNGHAVKALWLGLAALMIDSTDGLLARRFRVKELLPSFDGRRLDDIVDYMTYVLAPILLLWSSGYLPAGTFGVALAALPLLASSYQFCRVDAKTEDGAKTDHFFLGFPSYWNVLARLLGVGVRPDPVRLPVAYDILPQTYPDAHDALARKLRRYPHPDAGPGSPPPSLLTTLPRLLLRSEPLYLRQDAQDPPRRADRSVATLEAMGSRAAILRLPRRLAVRPRYPGPSKRYPQCMWGARVDTRLASAPEED